MAGYVRQSTADIIPTATVRAAPINAEYNALRDAFAASGGHKHDGTSGEGEYVPLIADLDALNKVIIDTTNNRVGVFVEVSAAAVEQIRIQDGVIVPVTDNDIDLGTSSVEFKDLYLDGTAYIDTLAVHESATITSNFSVNGNTTLGNAASDTVTFTADVASSILPSADDTYDLGSSASQWRNLYIDGTANIDSLVADTADINGGTLDGVTIGGSTAAAADFTTMDASGNATVGGTLGVTGATTLSSTLTVTGATALNGGLTLDTNKFTVADTTGNTAIAGTLDVTGATALASTLDVTGATTVADFTATGTTVLPATSFGDANITNVGNIALDSITADGSSITITGNTTFADGAYDFDIASHDTSNGLKLAGTLVTATATELNYNDTGSSVGTVVASKTVTVDGNKDVSSFRNLTATGDITTGNLVISDGGNIGSASDTNAISIASDGDVTVSQSMTVTGDLTVNGSTNTISTTNTVIEDALIELGAGTTGTPSNDAGIVIERGDSNNAFIGFDESEDKFKVGTGTFTGSDTGNLTITTGTLVANIEGNLTGTVTGNASGLTGMNTAISELNIMDGDTSATSTTLEDADRVVVNDAGTMKQVALTDFETYFESALDTLSNVTTVGTLNSGSITSGFGSIDNGSSAITTTGTITFGTLSDGSDSVTDIVTSVGSGSANSELPTALAVENRIQAVSAISNNVTGLNATGAELNAVADVSAITIDTSTAIANNDGIAVFDSSASAIGYFDVDLLDTYFAGTTKTLTNKTITSPTVSGLYLSDAGFIVEGSSADGNETTVTFTDPTADRTITFPNATGTVALSGATQNVDFGTVTADGLTVDGDITATGDTFSFTSANAEDPLVILKNTTNDANSARLRFVKDKGAAGADGDDAGEIEFYADNDAQEQILFARIKGEVKDASDGAEGGQFKFQVASHDGEMITALLLADGSAEDEVDVVIGSGSDSITEVSGSLGIGTSSPTAYGNSQATLVIEDDTNPALAISDTGQARDWYIVGFGDGLGIRYADGGGSGSASNVTESAFFKNNGNVGIGTSSPSDLLELSGSTAQPAIRLTDSDVSGLYHRIFTPSNTGLAISADTGNVAADSFIRLDVDGSEAMRIDSSGRLLLGNTDGSYASANADNIVMGDRTSSAESGITFGSTLASSLRFADAGAVGQGIIQYVHDDTVNTDYMNFYTAATERMRIDSSGNVGIGTTSPSNTLSLEGSGTGLNINSTNDEVKKIAFENSGVLTGYIGSSSASPLRFLNGSATEYMRIDSSGNVGIGTSSPSSYNSSMNDLVVSGSGDSGITIASGISSEGSIAFADGTVGGDAYRGWINYNHNSNFMRFSTNATERMRIDSGGNVGIGISSPSKKLDVDTTMRVRNASGTSAAEFDIGSGSTWRFRAQPTTGPNAYGLDIVRGSAGTDIKMSINSSGNVGIGTDSPSDILQVNHPSTAKASSIRANATNGDAYFAVGNSDLTDFILLFGGHSGNNASTVGWDDSNVLRFATYENHTGTFGAERMRIDSSGNLLVGTTTLDIANNGSNTGFVVNNNGAVEVGSSSTVLTLNKYNDDDIIRFQKDGAAAGVIGTSGVDLTIGTGDVGLKFNDASNRIDPWNVTTNASVDGAFDLGKDDRRFKDLFLSGGVYLGGAVAANKLDDYEEGTWEPTLFAGSVQATLEHQGVGDTQGVYTKIGRQVTLHAEVDINNLNGGTGIITVRNLPFTVGNYLLPTGIEANGSISYWAGWTSSISYISIYANSSSELYLTYLGSSTGTAPNDVHGTHIGTGEFRFTITYFTS